MAGRCVMAIWCIKWSPDYSEICNDMELKDIFTPLDEGCPDIELVVILHPSSEE